MRTARTIAVVLAAVSTFHAAKAQEIPWAPAGDHIRTRWARDVRPEAPLPEYPRPTLVRERWTNLNGQWAFRITTGDAKAQLREEGHIVVPFPIESSLSGVGRRLKADEALHLSRSFAVPADWSGGGQRVLLHFGAVNWQAQIRLNAKPVGEHTGGYDPFTIDITDALNPGDNQLEVVAQNPGNSGGQPRGKQFDTSHSIWYESSSGIWQTVWMEPVSSTRIERILASGDPATGKVDFTVTTAGDADKTTCTLQVLDGDAVVATGTGTPGASISCVVPKAKPWSPDSPHLYTIKASLGSDSAASYFAFREVKVAKDAHGVNRLMLNGAPLFQFGPLDQGYWPDGLYTAPTDEALKFDIQAAKRMGCNMLRKHVKVEPERFYYWCDRLGIMVWQDMPSSFFRAREFDEGFPEFNDKWAANFEREWKAIIEARRAHPSIVMWVPFNEGWGQNDRGWAKSVVLKTKQWDPSRLVNNASGWHDMGVGDVHDIHAYPEPATPPTEDSRAAVLGEFGGLGLPIEGHTWITGKDNWGYRSYKNKDEVTDAYCDLIGQIPSLIAQGMCAAVYTQTTDVEIECNGWLTYDREQWKIDPDRARAATLPMYGPVPTLKTVLPRAEQDIGARTWKYTTGEPGPDWMKPDAPLAGWKEGPAGFGSRGTPGAIIGTEWTTPDIWIRSEFTLDTLPQRPNLAIHHDEDAEIYINGTLAMSLKSYTSAYMLRPLSKEAASLLKTGRNTIAIHCRQTRGGQFIDCGITDVEAAK